MDVYASNYEPNDPPHARRTRADYQAGLARLGSRDESFEAGPHRLGAAWPNRRTLQRTHLHIQSSVNKWSAASRDTAFGPSALSMAAKLLLRLHTGSASSDEERTPGAAAQVERVARCCCHLDSGTRACSGRATVTVLVSLASAPRVSGCTRSRRYFPPHPVREILFSSAGQGGVSVYGTFLSVETITEG